MAQKEINDYFMKESMYSENDTAISAIKKRASLDYRPMVNKDLVGKPLPEGIYDEDKAAADKEKRFEAEMKASKGEV